MTITTELNTNSITLFSSANTSNTAIITLDSNSKEIYLNADNVHFPQVEDDLVCTITPRTTGANLAPLVEINSTGVYGYEFVSSSLKEVSFMVQLNHQWKAGSNVVPHLHWCPSTANTSNVRFSLDYWIASRDTTIPSITTLTANVTPNGAFKHQYTPFGNVVTTGNTISCIFGGRLYRDPSASGDDFTGDAIILGVDLHVIKNQWGETI